MPITAAERNIYITREACDKRDTVMGPPLHILLCPYLPIRYIRYADISLHISTHLIQVRRGACLVAAVAAVIAADLGVEHALVAEPITCTHSDETHSIQHRDWYAYLAPRSELVLYVRTKHRNW